MDWIVSPTPMPRTVWWYLKRNFGELIRFRWGHWWGKHHNGISTLSEGTPESLLLFSFWHIEGSHPQGKKVLTAKWSCQHSDLSLSASRKCEKIHFCCLSLLVYDILLWKPEKTKTTWYIMSILKCSSNVRMDARIHSASPLHCFWTFNLTFTEGKRKKFSAKKCDSFGDLETLVRESIQSLNCNLVPIFSGRCSTSHSVCLS